MSITVPLYGFGGGGGAALDLKIIPGLDRPVNPTPNMIWVKTDKEITGYALSAEKPENPTEGLLWLGISDSSAIKETVPVGKEYVTLYFSTGAIYTSGAWVDVTTMSYQDGGWVEWITYLIKDDVSVDFLATGAAISKSAGGLVVKPNATGKTVFVYTKEKYELAKVSKIVLSEIYGESNSYTSAIGTKLPAIGISSKEPPDLLNLIAFKEIGLDGRTLTVDDGGTELDVSGYHGLYNIFISFEAANTNDIVISDLSVR